METNLIALLNLPKGIKEEEKTKTHFSVSDTDINVNEAIQSYYNNDYKSGINYEDIPSFTLVCLMNLAIPGIILLISSNIITWIVFGVGAFETIFVIGYVTLKAKLRKTNWYLTYLFLTDFYIGLCLFSFYYLVVICKNFLLPIQITASNKEDWISSIGHVVTYKPVIGIAITFIVLLALNFAGTSVMSLFLSFIEEVIDEGLDRLVITIALFQWLVDLALIFAFKFEAIRNNTAFVVIASVAIMTSIVYTVTFVYYMLKREFNQMETLFYKRLYYFGFVLVGLHVLQAIIIFSYYPSLYSSSYATFSYNYDANYIKTTFNDDKYAFVGSLDEMTSCPKEFILFNWEDPLNHFGCLKIGSYYKGRLPSGLLLDCALAIPFFDFFFLWLITVLYEDDNYKRCKYMKKYRSQLKFRAVTSFFLGVMVLCIMAYAIISGSYTKMALFTHETINRIPVENYRYIDQIVPPSTDGLTVNYEITYALRGTIISEDSIDITIRLIPTDTQQQAQERTIKANTNQPFVFNDLHAYRNNVPFEYSLSIEAPSSKVNYGNIRIGGLLTGRHISLGSIPLIKDNVNPVFTGSIKGSVFKSSDFTYPISNVNVYVAKGYYYPSFTDLNQEPLIITNYIGKALTDSQGNYTFSNIAQGVYTLLIEKQGYYVEHVHFSITQSTQTIFSPVYLTQLLYSNTIGIALDWPNKPRDLDLLMSFGLNSKALCIVGYMNNQCVGASLTYTNDNGGINGIEMITINAISNYTYSVFVHKYSRNYDGYATTHFAPGFMAEEPVEPDQVPLNQSQARVKLYLPEYKYALVNDEVPNEGNGNYWKVFELNPKNSIELIKLYDTIEGKI